MQRPSNTTLTIVALCFVAIFVLMGYAPTFAALSASLQPKDEPYTELYVSQGPTLKSGVVIFSFTIHNVEGHAMTYPYLIYAQGQSGPASSQGGQGKILKYDNVAVEDGQYTTVDVHFGVPYNPAVILVDLPQLRQQIHFALPTK